MRPALLALALMLGASPALAADLDTMQEILPEKLEFKDNPAFPKGAQTVVLFGDPSKPGLFTLRAKFPPNYIVPAHTHPAFESVTVLTGSMGSGMGAKVEKKGQMLKPGAMLALPAKHPHYVWTEGEETIIQVTAIGPFDLTYVNPEEDPRKKQ